jgi:predicted DCC family thiol-disulfide oxidoreductase YuxK
MDRPDPTEVLYNAECPVCRFEIGRYAAQARRADLPLRFDGLDQAADWGLTPDQAARRLHVRHQGQVLAGVDAFLVLWRSMPRTRWLARLVALPVIRPLAGFGYDLIVAPLIYRWHLRRQARRRP